MKAQITYTNGSAPEEFDTIQAAVGALVREYPEGVIIDAGGFERDEYTPDEVYDVRGDRAVSFFKSEEDSKKDFAAIASVEVVDDDDL
jgi:hypothetical protein